MPDIQYVLKHWVKESTAVLGMISKFQSALFFKGHVKGVEWIKKIDEAEKKVQACLEKCMKNAV